MLFWIYRVKKKEIQRAGALNSASFVFLGPNFQGEMEMDEEKWAAGSGEESCSTEKIGTARDHQAY
jgi:hypothetical protein